MKKASLRQGFWAVCCLTWSLMAWAVPTDDTDVPLIPPPLQGTIAAIDPEFGMLQLEEAGFLSLSPKTVVMDENGYIRDTSWLEVGQAIRYEIKGGKVTKILIWGGGSDDMLF